MKNPRVHHHFPHEYCHEQCHLGVCPIFRHPHVKNLADRCHLSYQRTRGGQECEKHQDRVFPAEPLNCSWWRCGRKICLASDDDDDDDHHHHHHHQRRHHPDHDIHKSANGTPSFFFHLCLCGICCIPSAIVSKRRSRQQFMLENVTLDFTKQHDDPSFRRLLGQTE